MRTFAFAVAHLLLEDLKALQREGIREYNRNDSLLHDKKGEDKRWFNRRMIEQAVELFRHGVIDRKGMVNYLRKNARHRDDTYEWEQEEIKRVEKIGRDLFGRNRDTVQQMV